MPKWQRFRQSGYYQAAQEGTTLSDYVDARVEQVQEAGSEALSTLVEAAAPVFSSITSGIEASLSQFTFCGSTGDFLSAMEYITLSAKFQDITPTYPEKIGSPCMKSLYINTLSGFVQCERPVFRSSFATTVEEEAVEAFMAAGMFYE